MTPASPQRPTRALPSPVPRAPALRAPILRAPALRALTWALLAPAAALLAPAAALLAPPAALCAQDAQAASRPIASYTDGDRVVTVTAGDVALEMGFHLRRKDDGRAAAEHLVSTSLVRHEAEKRELWPTEEQVQALWKTLSDQLRAQGHDPMQVPVVRNSGLDAFLEDLAVQLAHEQLVRDELELTADERVSGEMLKLWVAEQRRRVPVVTDPDQLPAGTAIRVGGKGIPLLDLGMLLLRTSDTAEQDRFIRQVVVLELVEKLAREEGLTVSKEDIDNEVAARRALAQRDPRYRGMSFEQLLEAQGVTIDWLHQSRVFRGQLLQKKIVARRNPREQLLAEIAADRQAVLDRAGPRRRLGLIFVRALDEPNQLVPRDFEAATTHLQKVRQRLADEQFEVIARIESEEPTSKMRGGDLGWFQRVDDRLPAVVLDAAFQLEPGGLSEPVRGDEGCYLVKVLDVEPDPTEEELVVRLREQLVEQLTADLLSAAAITRADGTPFERAEVQGTDREDGK